MTVLEITDEMEISVGSADSILNKDLGMLRVVAKFVPKLLPQERRQLCVMVSKDMLQSANRNSVFLKTVVSVAEMLVYGYNLETKVQ